MGPQRVDCSLSDSSNVIYCRLLGLNDLANDQIAYAVRQLRDTVADELQRTADMRVHSSVYGRFVVVPRRPEQAIDLARKLLQAAADKHVALAIGVAQGRLEVTQDVLGENLAGVAINRAARLAHVQHEKCRIAVAADVVEQIRKSKAEYAKAFMACEKTLVKRTTVEFHYLKFNVPRPKKKPTAQDTSETAHIVAVDIAKYSEKDLRDQVQNAEGLLRKNVGRAFEAIGGLAGLMDGSERQYAPGGDGGVIVFRSGHAGGARAAWAFARELRKHCREHITVRIGITSGPVVVLEHDYPVGHGVLEADKLSAKPGDGEICCSGLFWEKSLEGPDRSGWEASECNSLKDALLLRDHSGNGSRPPIGDDRIAHYRKQIVSLLVGFPDSADVRDIAQQIGVAADASQDSIATAVADRVVGEVGYELDGDIWQLNDLRSRWLEKGKDSAVRRLDEVLDWLIPVRFDRETLRRIEHEVLSRDIVVVSGTATQAGTAIAISYAVGGTDTLRKQGQVGRPIFHPGDDHGLPLVTAEGAIKLRQPPPDHPDNDLLLTLQDLATQIDLDPNLHPQTGTREERIREYGEQIHETLQCKLRTDKRLFYCFVNMPDDKDSPAYKAKIGVMEGIYNRVKLLVFVQLNPNSRTRLDENKITQLLLHRFKPARKGLA